MQVDQFTTRDLQSLPQSWPLPRKQHAIDIIAAGGIVRDAHLPAYRKAGFPVAGIYDPDPEQAHARAREFGIPRVYESWKIELHLLAFSVICLYISISYVLFMSSLIYTEIH